MRRLFTTAGAQAAGITRDALRWGVRTGRWRRVERSVYIEGSDEPSPLERAVAGVIATGGIASGSLAGVLHGFDGVDLTDTGVLAVPPSGNGRRPGARRRRIDPGRIVTVAGVRCTDGTQTIRDLARSLDEDRLERALESALRRRLTTIAELESGAVPPAPRRVLDRRPDGAPPTESLLETLMVQLVRTIPGLPAPQRQYEVYDEHGQFVARVDLAWPELGVFVELDGMHHRGQPVYDARRQTAVAAATGWLCGRFTWVEVVHHPRTTARRLAALLEQGGRRSGQRGR